MHAKNNENLQEKELQLRAYKNVQAWLRSLYNRKLAQYDEDGVARVSERVAARFSLGLHEDNIFIAMRNEEASWAEDMPWDYAAVYRGKKDLYLVASPIETEIGISDPFGLSFQLRSISEAASLIAYENIQMRRFARGIDHFQNPMVSRLPFAQIPIFMLEQNQSVFDVNIKPRNKFDSKGSK